MTTRLANPTNVSGETLNTPNTDASPKDVDESEKNATVADTYTQGVPGEMNVETDSTMVSNINTKTATGNAHNEASGNMVIDTLAQGIPQYGGSTASGSGVTGRHMQSEHNTFVHPIYAADTTPPNWEDGTHVYTVLNSPPATDYWKELDNEEVTMNEGNYPNRPWVVDPTRLDLGNTAQFLNKLPHNVGT